MREWHMKALSGERDALADISQSKVDVWAIYDMLADEFPREPYSLTYRDTLDTWIAGN